MIVTDYEPAEHFLCTPAIVVLWAGQQWTHEEQVKGISSLFWLQGDTLHNTAKVTVLVCVETNRRIIVYKEGVGF
jgi:hypothetical protein